MLSSLALILACGALVSSAPTEQLTDLLFEDAGSVQITARNIYAIQWDQYAGNGSMLVAWGSELITKPALKLPKNVAGSVHQSGYLEGTGDAARFSSIAGFVQVSNSTRVIVSDRENCCLRVVDRITGTTSHFAGKCSGPNKCKFVDGSSTEARFSRPSGLVLDARDPTKVLVMDEYNNAIRSVDIDTGATTTVFQSKADLTGPRSAVFDVNKKNVLYVTHRRTVSMLDLTDNKITKLTGIPQDRSKFTVFDGRFDEATFGYYLGDIDMINDRYLAVTDFYTHKVRIIDLLDRVVFSMCSDDVVIAYDENKRERKQECGLTQPVGIMYDNGKLYIGENGRITIKSVIMTNGENGVVG